MKKKTPFCYFYSFGRYSIEMFYRRYLNISRLEHARYIPELEHAQPLHITALVHVSVIV